MLGRNGMRMRVVLGVVPAVGLALGTTACGTTYLQRPSTCTTFPDPHATPEAARGALDLPWSALASSLRTPYRIRRGATFYVRVPWGPGDEVPQGDGALRLVEDHVDCAGYVDISAHAVRDGEGSVSIITFAGNPGGAAGSAYVAQFSVYG